MEVVPQIDEDFSFIYQERDSLDLTRLSQGDILARTQDCVRAIEVAHQYYANSVDYTHFVVITQSCDLVRRGGRFNAPYITIAAAKKLSHVLAGALPRAKPINRSSMSYRSPSDMKRGRQLIERYINNTESNHFFLPRSEQFGVQDDLVVFLHLSIALRKDHYDVLSRAKIASLRDVFQAKLGWLKGNIYSRVATPDIEEEGVDGQRVKNDYYERYIPTLELSGHQAEKLKRLVADEAGRLGRDLAQREVMDLVSQLPDDIEIVAEKLVDRLINANIIARDDERINLARRTIANSPVLKGMMGHG